MLPTFDVIFSALHSLVVYVLSSAFSSSYVETIR
jgi:hypothetical protein